MTSLAEYFSDPVLRAPTLGSMLMCLASSLVGVLIFVSKKALVGEALSHACYPGVALGVLGAALFFPHASGLSTGMILLSAFFFSWLSLKIILYLEKKGRVSSDAALCFVPTVFFGGGVLLASHLQFTHPLWYREIQVFLYGQAATMLDIHVLIYSLLCIGVVLAVILFYRSFQVGLFDADFAKSIGISVERIQALLSFLLVLAVVIGMRSVGVVLMAGMLIAPAVAARQFTKRLSTFFLLASLFGVLSGFLGNYFSQELVTWLPFLENTRGALPTGPAILLTAVALSLFALFFAPQNGFISRFWRIARFKRRCRLENTLKAFWKKESPVSFEELRSWHLGSPCSLAFDLWHLQYQGWLKKEPQGYLLTKDGRQRASHIIRLHRLWEVYLVDYLGQGAERVHRNAEEMEHILTPALERELTDLLHDPKQDPHRQPIPPKERL